MPEQRGTIIYLGGFELPDGNAAAHRVRGNARIFRDLGYRVVLLGVSRAPWGGADIRPADSGDEGIEAYEIPYPRGKAEWLARTVSSASFLQLLRVARIDDLAIVICYNFPALAQWQVARQARKRGGLAVADVTEWYRSEQVRSIASLVKNLDTPLRMRIINRWMDALITTSPFITEYYRRDTRPVVELPTIFPTADPPVMSGSGDDPLVKTLVFAGLGIDLGVADLSKDSLKDRLDWVLELLVGAKRRGARFVVDLYGVTRADYLTIVPSQLPIADELVEQLRFHGRVPNAALLKTLREADFSIFMRKKTRVTLAGFPGKFAESVTCGTPVITNSMPSTARYMVEGKTGFYLDPDDFEASISRLVEILALPRTEVQAMKEFCARSHIFDHTSFIEPVSVWLSKLGLAAPKAALLIEGH